MLSSDAIRPPSPLICIKGDVEGEKDVPKKLVDALQLSYLAMAQETQNKLHSVNFRILSEDHILTSAKSNSSSKSRRTFLNNNVIKRTWMTKHCDDRPSVVIMLCKFDLGWNPFEWSEKEAVIQSRFINVMTNLAGTGTKLQLVAVKTGGLGGGALEDSELLDTRVGGLTEALQIDKTTFTMIDLSDFDGTGKEMSEGESPIQLLWNNILVNSMNYYASMVKKSLTVLESVVGDVMRVYSNGVGGDTVAADTSSPQRGLASRDVTLLGLARARYNFKAGYFCEFQGLSYSASYYQKAFQSLVSVVENVDGDDRGAVLYAAELINFKICLHSLSVARSLYADRNSRPKMTRDAEVASVKAVKQFDFMVKSFKGLDSAKAHNEWMCKQYVLFLGLVENLDAVRHMKVNVGEYYIVAAKYAIAVRDDTVKSLSDLLGDSPKSDDSDRFVVRLGFALSNSSPSAARSAPGAEEGRDLALDLPRSAMDHNGFIGELLQRAHEYLGATHPRRKAYALTMQCEQCMQQGNFSAAMSKLQPMLKELQSDEWGFTLAAPFLRKKMACAIYLGQLEDYLDGALRLYSLAVPKGQSQTSQSSSVLSRYEVEELHRDMLSVMSNFGREPLSPGPRDVPFSPPSSKPTNYVCVPFRPEYGMSCPGELAFVLPPNYTYTASTLPTSAHPRLIDVKVDLGHRTTYKIGDTVHAKLHITSLFLSRISFAELVVRWSFDSLEQRYVHQCAGGEEEGDGTRAACLDLFPHESIALPLSFVLSEASLAPILDDGQLFLCVASVDFVVRSSFCVGPGGIVAPPQGTPGAHGYGSSDDLQTPTPSPLKGGDASVPNSSLEVTPDTCLQDFILRVLSVPDELAAEHRRLVEGKHSKSDMSDYINSAGGLNLASELSLNVIRVVKPRSTVELLWPTPASSGTRRKAAAPGISPVSSTSFTSLEDAISRKQQSSAASGDGKSPPEEGTRLLSGALQTLELLFSCGEDDVLGDPTGQVSVSSDVEPESAESALFWWPSEVPQSESSGAPSFHPLKLDKSNHQPLARYSLASFRPGPDTGTFILPLYLYSATSGVVDLQVTVEYAHQLKVCDYLVRVNFVKPFDILFDIEHAGDTWMGMHTQQVPQGDATTAVLIRSPINPGNGAQNTPTREKGGERSSAKPSGSAKAGEGVTSKERDDHAVLRGDSERVRSAPIVLCGDNLSVSATLTCLEDLGGEVEIRSFTLTDSQPPHSLSSADVAAHTEGSRLFRILGVKNNPQSEDNNSARQVIDLIEATQSSPLQTTGDNSNSTVIDGADVEYTSMSKEEVVHGVADVVCLPLVSRMDRSKYGSLLKTPRKGDSSANLSSSGEYVVPSQIATIGHVSVKWRLKRGATNSPGETSAVPKLLLPSDTSASDDVQKGASLTSAVVDSSVVRSSLNETSFEIPPVTLVEPPFHIDVAEPPHLVAGRPASMSITVTSRLWTVEKVRLSVEEIFGAATAAGGEIMEATDGGFLVTGRVLQGVVVPPRGSVTVTFSVTPVRCGYSLLPKVQLLWSAQQAGMLHMRRAVFVRPAEERPSE